MTTDLALTLGALALAFVALSVNMWSPEMVLLTALALVTVGGVVDLETALQGFGNPVLLALGSLYVVAAALRDSGALDRAGEFLLGRRKRRISAILLRMCPSVTGYSAFLNNTPVVAMGIPTLRRWGRQHGVPASKLLIPLSYAAILGGLCTLIGTSTNLVTHGLLQDQGLEGLGFFELARIGVPTALAGLAYIIFVSPSLLPDRSDIREEEERRRSLLIELELSPDSLLVGDPVGDLGLEELPGLRLTRINRAGREIGPVAPDEVLHAGDHLFYEAEADAWPARPDLDLYPGLQVVSSPPRAVRMEFDRELHEVVVRDGSGLVGSTIETAKFGERFGAAVTGVRRGGRRLDAPLREIVLHTGDVLMLDTGRGFREAFEDSEAFFLTTEAEEEDPIELARELVMDPKEVLFDVKNIVVSVAVLAGIVISVAAGLVHVALAGLLGVTVLFALNVIEPAQARQAVDWSVLLVIGAALGLAHAMEASGAAALVADGLVRLTMEHGPWAVVGGIVVTTALVTELLTNNSAAALMFPIAISVAEQQGYEPRGLVIAVTLAASMSLLTPIGYQTNLMVYGPGNYRFTDFFRVGFPLQVLLWIVVIALVPLMWPL